MDECVLEKTNQYFFMNIVHIFLCNSLYVCIIIIIFLSLARFLAITKNK